MHLRKIMEVNVWNPLKQHIFAFRETVTQKGTTLRNTLMSSVKPASLVSCRFLAPAPGIGLTRDRVKNNTIIYRFINILLVKRKTTL